MTTIESHVESIVQSNSNEHLTVDTLYDDVIVEGYWDDLDPEPYQSNVREDLHRVKRTLEDEGFDVSGIDSQYGLARLRIL